jgi:sulfonate transport system permease protein
VAKDVAPSGLGMAWTVVVAAEFLGAQTGLGQIIVYSQYFGHVDRMFLVALILLTYAAITYALFERASRRLTDWMPRDQARATPAASWAP